MLASNFCAVRSYVYNIFTYIIYVCVCACMHACARVQRGEMHMIT